MSKTNQSNANHVWKPVEGSPGGDWPTGQAEQGNIGIETVKAHVFLLELPVL